jgi:polysaccharide export outer membrane protein
MAPARRLVHAVALVLVACAAAAGCRCQPRLPDCPANASRECVKTLLPDYVIEPPDILLIDALHVVPLPPYKVKSLDVLAIRVLNVLPDEPIAGAFPVDPDGTVNLGASYRTVKVVGLTLPEVKELMEKHLKGLGLKDPRADVSLAEGRGLQQIRGPHLVGPDGTVNLGAYGNVMVTGLTRSGAKAAIEVHLSAFLDSPEVSIDVAAYNSKVYYVIYDGGGAGQQVYRLPVTGNDTVLDAVSQLNGLSPVSDTKKIWVARPNCAEKCAAPDIILPVDWCGITARGRAETNYQLMPGDRLYVQSSWLVSVDNRMARLFSPLERILGLSLLDSSAVHAYEKGRNNP